MLLVRAVRVHQFAHHVFRDAQDVITLIFSFQRGAANRIDRLALFVHHIVVFKKVFARVEILGLDRFLRVFNAPRDEARFDRHAFGHP